MEKLTAFYFSGTGNTRYVVERLCSKLATDYLVQCQDITAKCNFGPMIERADVLLFGFPIYGSAPPIPMRRFVHRYRDLLCGKRVLIAETQYFFSGDGAASLGRTLEKFGAVILGAEHFNMPNNLADCKVFPVKTSEDAARRIGRTARRVDAFAERILHGKTKKRGFRLLSHAVGYYCQRKFWWINEQEKRKMLRVSSACVGCGKCVKECPAGNLTIADGRAHPLGKCVLCYRCINHCPRQAITLFGTAAPATQYHGPLK